MNYLNIFIENIYFIEFFSVVFIVATLLKKKANWNIKFFGIIFIYMIIILATKAYGKFDFWKAI